MVIQLNEFKLKKKTIAFTLPSCSYDKGQLGLSGHIEVFALSGNASQSDQVLLFLLVFSHILFGSLEYVATSLLLLLLVKNESARACSSCLGILFALLEQRLWHLWQLTWRLSFALRRKKKRRESNTWNYYSIRNEKSHFQSLIWTHWAVVCGVWPKKSMCPTRMASIK